MVKSFRKRNALEQYYLSKLSIFPCSRVGFVCISGYDALWNVIGWTTTAILHSWLQAQCIAIVMWNGQTMDRTWHELADAPKMHCYKIIEFMN